MYVLILRMVVHAVMELELDRHLVKIPAFISYSTLEKMSFLGKSR